VTTAVDVLAVVRVHADRVHDAVRRLGVGPEDAVMVVERSAMDLVQAARQAELDDPVGWWFARARVLARQGAGSGDDDLPVGGGVLGGDANQVRLAEALEARPERERAALLLRDSYDLPAHAVGTVLNLDANGAMEVVGAARLAYLPTLLGGPSLSLAGHVADLASLARLAEGGRAAAGDATTRRHAQSCDRCADAIDAMERARRLLSGLTVVALPDAEREALLQRVERYAGQTLPATTAIVEEDEWEDEPHRPYSLSLIALGLVAAVGLGVLGGVLASRAHDTSVAAQVRNFNPVTQPPAIVVAVPSLTPTPIPTTSPTPRVTYLPPSQTPSPTASATPTASASSTETIQPTITIDPTSGPSDTQISVSGTNWLPNTNITVTYRSQITTGATVQVESDDTGTFSTSIQAHDPGLAGPHEVQVTDGVNTNSVTFTQT
jgi:DNA-directed RNA polymerase specialized sigma24 family protein